MLFLVPTVKLKSASLSDLLQSSLLMAILKELQLKEGKIDVRGKVAYTSQEAWIFNGTVRYNITFGQEFNEKRYNDVIKACALDKVGYKTLNTGPKD